MSGVQPDGPKPNPFAALPRCDAKTRAGHPCRQPAARKGRCHWHGGSRLSGAPKGNKNRWVQGQRSRAAIAERKRVHPLPSCCCHSLFLLLFPQSAKGIPVSVTVKMLSRAARR